MKLSNRERLSIFPISILLIGLASILIYSLFFDPMKRPTVPKGHFLVIEKIYIDCESNVYTVTGEPTIAICKEIRREYL